MKESQAIKILFEKLLGQERQAFPTATSLCSIRAGGYIIRKKATVRHVGRTVHGTHGLNQRLRNHPNGAFTITYLRGKGDMLRKNGYTVWTRDGTKKVVAEHFFGGPFSHVSPYETFFHFLLSNSAVTGLEQRNALAQPLLPPDGVAGGKSPFGG